MRVNMLRELMLGHTGLADHSASMLASAAERTPASLTLHTCEDDHGIDSAQKVLSVLEVLIAHTTHIIGQQNTELLKTVYSNMLSLAVSTSRVCMHARTHACTHARARTLARTHARAHA